MPKSNTPSFRPKRWRVGGWGGPQVDPGPPSPTVLGDVFKNLHRRCRGLTPKMKGILSLSINTTIYACMLTHRVNNTHMHTRAHTHKPAQSVKKLQTILFSLSTTNPFMDTKRTRSFTNKQLDCGDGGRGSVSDV